MSRLVIALALALSATAANAQNSNSGQSRSSGAADADGMRPFLFDARLPGDEIREKAARDRQPIGGTIVAPPKTSQPQRER